jgi:LytS/YehU family sensor histidine kinase
MQHPVFQNLKSVIIYFGVWIVVATIHFIVSFYIFNLPFDLAVAQSLIVNLTFGLLGIPVWFVVRYSELQKKAWWNVFFNHLTSMSLIIVICTAVSFSLLRMMFTSRDEYDGAILTTLPVTIIGGIFYYFFISLVYYLIIYYNDLQEKLKVEARLNELLKESELNMLKSQINPHFLFNSLNSISSLTLSDAAKAREMVIKLSDFMRYSVSTDTHSLTTVAKELGNITRYLDIEKVRFGDKLVYHLDIHEACMKHPVPVMLLQPLYENAIKHGVYESTQQVTIDTVCRKEEDFMVVQITNDFDPEAISRRGAGLGLKNIRERLRLTYHRYDLLVTEKLDGKFVVTLKIPVAG